MPFEFICMLATNFSFHQIWFFSRWHPTAEEVRAAQGLRKWYCFGQTSEHPPCYPCQFPLQTGWILAQKACHPPKRAKCKSHHPAYRVMSHQNPSTCMAESYQGQNTALYPRFESQQEYPAHCPDPPPNRASYASSFIALREGSIMTGIFLFTYELINGRTSHH